VRRWDLGEIVTPGGSVSPVVLHSNGEGRAVLIGLDPGQELREHQVREHAFVLVLEGTVRVQPDEEATEAGPGTLFLFEPAERRTVSSAGGARLLLLFAPWPAEGHYPQ
jgi:quercetin dioxygenase-like cupin family protein